MCRHSVTLAQHVPGSSIRREHLIRSLPGFLWSTGKSITLLGTSLYFSQLADLAHPNITTRWICLSNQEPRTLPSSFIYSTFETSIQPNLASSFSGELWPIYQLSSNYFILYVILGVHRTLFVSTLEKPHDKKEPSYGLVILCVPRVLVLKVASFHGDLRA